MFKHLFYQVVVASRNNKISVYRSMYHLRKWYMQVVHEKIGIPSFCNRLKVQDLQVTQNPTCIFSLCTSEQAVHESLSPIGEILYQSPDDFSNSKETDSMNRAEADLIAYAAEYHPLSRAELKSMLLRRKPEGDKQ